MERRDSTGRVRVGGAPGPCEVAAKVAVSLRMELVARGEWSTIEAALRGSDTLGIVDVPASARWVPLEHYVQLVDAVRAELGDAALRELGRARVDGAKFEAFYQNIVKSWARTFRDDPARVLCVVPHVWRAALRGCGEIEVIDAGPGRSRFDFIDPPAALLTSIAWRTMLEGILDGVFRIAGVETESRIVLGTPPRAVAEWRGVRAA